MKKVILGLFTLGSFLLADIIHIDARICTAEKNNKNKLVVLHYKEYSESKISVHNWDTIISDDFVVIEYEKKYSPEKISQDWSEYFFDKKSKFVCKYLSEKELDNQVQKLQQKER